MEKSSREGTWHEPSDPFIEFMQAPAPPVEEDPDYIPIEQAMEARRRSKRKAAKSVVRSAEVETDTTTSAPVETDTSASAGGRQKRRRGQRSKNQPPKETYYITSLNHDGKPLEPKVAMTKFSSACGVLARTHGPLNVDSWEQVDDNLKNFIWNELQKWFVYLPGLEALGKEFALKTIGGRWRQWKSDLNTNYVQKNKSPFEDYGGITPTEWDRIVAKMTSPEALARRKKMSDLAKRNKYPRREVASNRRTVCRPRKAPACGCTKRKKQKLGVGTQYGTAEKEKTEEFIAKREHDQLTAALGNPEHSGRVRGVSSKTSKKRKEGFPGEAASYKKRDRYKHKLEQKIAKQVEEHFYSLVPHDRQVFPNFFQQSEEPTVHMPSSVGSVDTAPYPVDTITGPTPCSLLVPIGRAGKRKEVGTGLAIPGPQFHNTPIPKEYARVQVAKVHAEHKSLELDILAPEGIELLGDASALAVPRRPLLQTTSLPMPSKLSRQIIPKMIRSSYDKELMAKDKRDLGFLAFRGRGPIDKPQDQPTKLSDSQQSMKNIAKDLQNWTSDEVPTKYEYDKPFLPWHVMEDMPWEIRLMHDWYLKASKLGLSMLTVKVPNDAFTSGPNGMLVIDFNDLHALFRMEKMDINLVTTFCLMQYVDAKKTNYPAAFVNPTRICWTEHELRIREDSAEFKGKMKKQKDAIIKQLHRDKMIAVAFYLGRAMFEHRDKDVLMVPYALQAHHNYVRQGGPVKDPQKRKLLVKTNWLCYKQPPGTNLCGYYVCEMLRIYGRYTTKFEELTEVPVVANRFDDRTMLNLVADLCRFIRRDVCNHLGDFYDPESELTTDDKFKRLREWEKEHHH
uniref:Hydroxyproline-rich glycoprotein-like n=1 Tax=Oryza australiensis TaxID=4532 RepID=A0A1V1H155_9ORYZ|nr:hydroxyproline-rich glycoprotein -like [Oryza australiensis]